jgi:hypothetical protein
MANISYHMHATDGPPSSSLHIDYWIVDIDAMKPIPNHEGDLCYCKDTQKLYLATGINTWSLIKSS